MSCTKFAFDQTDKLTNPTCPLSFTLCLLLYVAYKQVVIYCVITFNQLQDVQQRLTSKWKHLVCQAFFLYTFGVPYKVV